MPADVHATARLSFHLEIAELLLIFIQAIGTLHTGEIPLRGAHRAVEDPFPFLPDFSHSRKSSAERTKPMGKGNLFLLFPPACGVKFEGRLQRLDQEKKQEAP